MTSCDAGCVLPANSFLPFCVDNLNKESLTLYVQMIKSKVDEEDYWHSSKFKAFTFDDEDDELSRLKESRQAVNNIRRLVEEDDDEDDVERVSWSGEPVGSISWSVKETAASSQRADREPAFPKISTDTPSISRSQSGYSLSSLFKGKPKVGNFQTFSDALTDSSVRLYAPELRKPKSEYKVRLPWLNRVLYLVI